MFTVKIHRHVRLSTKKPPMSGPVTLPNANTLVRKPTYRPRWRGGTMSPMITNAMAIKPPAPMPCTPRAMTSWKNDCDAPASSEPTRKMTIAARNSALRP